MLIEGSPGKPVTEEELARVEASLGLRLPQEIASMLRNFCLVGLCVSLDESEDLSGLGADFQWMSVEHMIEEGAETYPGIMAVPLGFLPVGMCSYGSGDPYFVSLHTGALVRIPHECAVGDALDVTQIEEVLSSVHQITAHLAGLKNWA